MRTYRIVRNERSGPSGANETTVLTGVEGFAAAELRAKQLQAEEDAAHPGRSPWVKVLYLPQLETPPTYRVMRGDVVLASGLSSEAARAWQGKLLRQDTRCGVYVQLEN